MPIPTEAAEQVDVFDWASREKIDAGRLGHFMFAIPNEGKRSKVLGAKMRAQGLRSGVPDIFLALPMHGRPGLFIEMKKQKGGVVSDNQEKWISRLKLAGYVVEVCKGAEEAKKVITNYLRGRYETGA